MPLEGEEADLSVPETALTVRYLKWDILLAVLLAGLVFAGLTAWSHPLMHPAIWQDAAVAAGVRPPHSMQHGLWTLLVSGVYAIPNIGTGTYALALLGRIGLSLATVLAYFFFREFLFITMRGIVRRKRRAEMLQRFFSFVAASSFAFSVPVWQLGHSFAPDTLTLVLMCGTLLAFINFLRGGSLVSLYVSIYMTGVLVGNSPLALVLAAFMWLAYYSLTRHVFAFSTPLSDLAVEQSSRWHMTLLAMGGVATSFALNAFVFIAKNGLGPVGETVSAVPLMLVSQYAGLLSGAATPIGWVMFFAVVLVPFLFCTLLLPASSDEEKILPYGIGFIYVLCSLIAFSQLGGFSKFWIWDLTWMTGLAFQPAISSRELVMLMVFLCSATLLSAMAVLGMEFYCRDHKYIVRRLYGGGDEELPEQQVKGVGMLSFFSRILQIIVPAGVLAAILFGCVWRCRQPGMRVMMSMIRAYVQVVLSETEGCRTVFTDGFFDPLIELYAKRMQNRELVTVSMLPDDSAYARFLRLRACTSQEDALALAESKSGHTLLKKWMRRDGAGASKGYAVENGLEVWLQENMPLPPVGAVVSQPSWGVDSPALKKGRKAAFDLARGIFECYKGRNGVVEQCHDEAVRNKFYSVQFSLAIAAKYRADWEDGVAGLISRKSDAATKEEEALQRRLVAQSIEDSNLRHELDSKNPIVSDLRKMEERRNQLAQQQLTPRERLQIAMTREAYGEAFGAANIIRNSMPNDYDANFAFAMYYMERRQWARSEEFFKRCLNVRPHDTRVYNNLACTQMRMHKFNAAERNIARALELNPGSAPLLRTQREIREAREAIESGMLDKTAL